MATEGFIENLSVSNASYDDAAHPAAFGSEAAAPLDGDQPQMAQAETNQGADALPAATSAQPGEQIVVAENNIVKLAAGTSIEKIEMDGDNLILVQPDGTRVVIEHAALHVPTFVIDDIEIPQEALVAALQASNINVAAGPDGTLTASAAGSNSAGGNFGEAIPGIGDAGPAIDLLGPTALQFGTLDDEILLPAFVNRGPSISLDGGVGGSAGGIAVSDRLVYEYDLPNGSARSPQSGFGVSPLKQFNFEGSSEGGQSAGGGTGPNATVKGVFVISDPDGLSDIAGIRINGQTFAPGDLAGKTFTGLYGTLTIVSFNAATGEAVYSYTLTKAYHSDGGDNGPTTEQDRDIFSLTVTDRGGLSASANLRIDIVDDVPKIFGQASSELPQAGVDETTFNLDASVAVEDFFGGLSYTYGADGPGAVTYKLELSAGKGEGGIRSGLYALDNTVDGGKGAEIMLRQDGQVIYGEAGGKTYFTISLANGVVTLDQVGPNAIWHESTGNPDDQQSLRIENGSLTIVATVTDGDGDTASQGIDLGSGVFTFRDDGPTLVVEGNSNITVDEDDILTPLSVGTSPNDGNGDGSYTGGTSPFDIGPSNASGKLATLVNFGADGPAAGGGFSFTANAAATLAALGLTSKGADLSYSLSGDTVTATAGGRTVFEFKLSGNGDFTFKLFDQLDHVTGGDQNTALKSATAQSGSIPSIDFGSIIQATDGDGDSVTLNGKANVTVTDDIPAPFLTATGSNVTHDESSGQQADDTDSQAVRNQFQALESAGGLTALGYAASFGPEFLFGALNGADEPTSRTISFGLANTNGVDSGLTATGGTPIFLFIENGLVVGRLADASGHADSSGRVAFAVSLSTNILGGQVAVAQYLAIEHSPNNGPNDIESLTGKINVVLSVTDADGDTVVKTVDIGGQIRFRDDAPVLVKGTSAHITVDEDDILTPLSTGTSPNDGNADGSYTGSTLPNDTGPSNASGTLATLVNFGADGPAAGGGFSFTVNAAATLAALGLTSKGADLSYSLSGDTVTATAGGRTVFEFKLSGNGDFTFNLFDQLDHVTGGGQNTALKSATAQSGSIPSIDFGSIIQATDGDGDSVTLGGKANVTVTDDIPQVEAMPAGTTSTPITYSIEPGNVLYRALQGKDDFDLLLTAKQGSQVQSVNTNGSNGGSANVGPAWIDNNDTLRVDFMKGLTATGNVNSDTYSAEGRFSVNTFTFSASKVQGNANSTATLFIRLFSVATNDDLTSNGVDFSHNGTVNISSITVNGLPVSLANLTAHDGGYVLTGVKEGDKVVVTGSGSFGRVEITNEGGTDFSVGGFGTSVETPQVFEVRHDETSGVNSVGDPNPADDTAASLPQPLQTATNGLIEMGHAVTTSTVSGLFTYKAGADETATVNYALTKSSGAAFNGVDSGLTTTQGGQKIFLYSEGNILWGVAGGDLSSGTKVFAAYVDPDGHLWLVQLKPVAHNVDGSDANAHDDAISVIADIRVSLSVTDADGDTVSKPSSMQIKLTFQDDGPVAHDFDAGTLTEDGASTTVSGNVATGYNNLFGADGQAATGSVAFGTATATLNGGAAVNLSNYGALTQNPNGTWSFVLNNSLPATQALKAGDTINVSFTYTLKDGDGDSAPATISFKITGADDTATVDITQKAGANGAASVVYEAGLDQAGTDHDGTNASATSETDTGAFKVAASDGIATVTIGGETHALGDWNGKVVDTVEGKMTITSVTVAGDGKTADFTYEYTLKANQTHANAAGNNTLTDTVAVAVDGIGGTTANGNVTITIVDDVPTANMDTSLVVAETAGVTSGKNLLANDTVGGDGAVVTHVSFDGGTNWEVIGDGPFAVNGVGTFTFAAGGAWSLDPVVNSSSQNQTGSFLYRITDGDNDISEARQDYTVANVNSVPVGGAVVAVVDDEGLKHGLAGGTGDDTSTASASYSGNLAGSGGDGALTYTFANLAGGSAPVGQESVNYSWNASLNRLIATIAISPIGARVGQILFTVDTTPAGAYTVKLINPVLHLQGNNENDATAVLQYRVSDNDADTTISDTGLGTLTISFDDDSPIAFTAQPMKIENGANSIGSGALHFYESIGADGGKVTFTPQNGATLMSGGESVKSGGKVVHLYTSDGDTTLSGKIDLDGNLANGDETTVFTIKLSPNANDQTLDNYTVQFMRALDDGSGTSITSSNFDSTSSSNFKIAAGEAGQDILISASGGQGRVNGSNGNSVTLGNGSGTMIDPGELLRFDFATGVTLNNPNGNNSISSPTIAHYNVQGFSFTVENSGVTSQILLRAFDANNDKNFGNDSQDTITHIYKNGVEIPLGVAAAGGGYIVSGVQGDQFSIYTEDGYNRVEVAYSSGSQFAISNVGTQSFQNGTDKLLNFNLIATDTDGDTSSGTLSITTKPLATTINGTSSDDLLVGGIGSQTLNGHDGNDTFIGGLGADTFNGGTHSSLYGDTVSYQNSMAGVTVDLGLVGIAQTSLGDASGDKLSGIESLIGSAFDDTLIGDGNANSLIGGGGNDTLYGGGGNDLLIGGPGVDTLWGGAGDDTFKLTDLTAADVIEDFAQGDQVDLTALLDGITLTAANPISNYVKVEEGSPGAHDVLKINTAGTGNAADFVTVAHLDATATGIKILYNDEMHNNQHTTVTI